MKRPALRRRDFLSSTAAMGASCLTASAVALDEVAAASSKGPEKAFGRERAARIIADARKIVTPNGIERLETVRIGGPVGSARRREDIPAQ